MIKSFSFDISSFNYKVRDVISSNFQILKNDPETSTISTDNPLISFRRNKNIRDNLVRNAALDVSCPRVRCYTCSFLNSATPFADLNPISLFGTILHAPPPPLCCRAFYTRAPGSEDWATPSHVIDVK